MTRRCLIVCALLAAPGLGLAGCGGAGSSGGGSATGSRAAAATGSASTSTTGTGSAAASTTSASTTSASTTTAATSSAAAGAAGPGSGAGGASVGGPAPCRAAGLTLTYLGGQGATGHGELGFALRNTSGTSCSTGGYPGVEFLDQAGGALATSPTHTTTDFFGSLPLKELTIAPGQSFSFRLGVSHGGGSSAACTTAYGLQVIAPNDTATLHVSIPAGASECGGATTVSPVQPGDSAYQ